MLELHIITLNFYFVCLGIQEIAKATNNSLMRLINASDDKQDGLGTFFYMPYKEGIH